MPTTLQTIQAVVVLDGSGKRLFAKYYGGREGLAVQHAFEQQLYKSVHKSGSEVALVDLLLVVFRELVDVSVLVVGGLEENEALLNAVLAGLVEALAVLTKVPAVDKGILSENYDLLALAVDETVDEGVVLETDAAVIASRVTEATGEENLPKIELSEKGIRNAWSFAKSNWLRG